MRRVAWMFMGALLVGSVLAVVPAEAEVPTVPGAPTAVGVVPAAAGVLVSWVAPIVDGGSPVTDYVVTPSTGEPVSVDGSVASVVVNANPGTAVSATVKAVNAVGASPPSASAGPATAAAPGGLVRVGSPKRLADSRYGTGITKAKLGAGSERVVQVTGKAGVPSSGVAAAYVNLMALDVTANASISAYPDGSSAPSTASMVALKGERVTHMLQVPVGPGGKIRVRNAAGSTNVVLDVYGYVLTPAASGASRNGLVTSTAPLGLVDTRYGTGAPKAKLGAGRNLDVTVAGKGGVPTSGVSAVIINLTAYNASLVTGLTVFPVGPQPGTQNLSAVPGANRSNRVIVPLGAGGKIRINNQYGTVDLKVDLAGWVSNGADAALEADSLNPQSPRRLLDTKTGTGGPKAQIAKGKDLTVTAAGVAGVPSMTSSTPPVAVLAFVRISTTIGYSTLSLRPTGAAVPSVADVSARVGQPMGNLAMVPLSADGRITMRNNGGSAGSIDASIDIVGWVGGSVLIAPGTKVLSTADLAAMSAITPAGYTLGAGPAAPAKGAVVTAPPSSKLPHGMLRRVTSVVVNPNGTRTVTTRTAGIAEVVRKGSLQAAVPMNGPVTVVRPGESAAAAPGQTSGTGPRIGAGVGSSITRSFSSEILPGVTAEGAFDASATADLTVDVGLFDVNAGFEAQASESLTGSLTVAAAASFSKTIDLGEYSFPTYYASIGPVPIVVQPQVELSAEAEGQAEGSVSMSFQQGVSGRTGITYDDGIDSFEEFTNTAPDFSGPTVSASAEAHVRLVASFELEFYGSAEIGIGLVGSLDLTTTECGVDLNAALLARLSFDLEVLGKDIVEASVDVPIHQWDLAEVEIGDKCDAWTGVVKVYGSSAYEERYLDENGQPYTVTRSYTADWEWRWGAKTPDPLDGGMQDVSVFGSETFSFPGGYFDCTSGINQGSASSVSQAGVSAPASPGGRWNLAVYALIPGSQWQQSGCKSPETPTSGTGNLGTPSFGCICGGIDWQLYTSAPNGIEEKALGDEHTVAGTTTQNQSDLCGLECDQPPVIDYTATITTTIRMTNRPDRDLDGIPDVLDPAPAAFNPL